MLTALIKDMLRQGFFVWHRNSLGKLISNLVLHICILAELFRLKSYIESKEDSDWDYDNYYDRKIDFYDASIPIFVLVSLYLIKLCLFKEQDTAI